MSPTKRRSTWVLFLGGLIGTILCFSIFLAFPHSLQRINDLVFDFQAQSIGLKPTSPLPVIIEVDEKSLRALGQWPWPRYHIANLIDQLNKAQPAAVGIDALFAEKDRTSPKNIKNRLSNDLNVNIALDNVPNHYKDYDKLFAERLSQGTNVLTHYFIFDKNLPKTDSFCNPKSTIGTLVNYGGGLQALAVAQKPICSTPTIAKSGSYSGFNNANPSLDGIYRKAPLVMVWENNIYPSFALQTYLSAQKLDHFYLVSHPDGGFTLRIGQREIPLDQTGSMVLRYKGPQRTYTYYSAIDIINNKINRNDLKDKIILIGFSAAGLMDFRPISLDPLYSGVEINASIIDNLLTQDFFKPISPLPYFELMLAVGIGIILSILMAWSNNIGSVILSFGTLVLTCVAAYLLLLYKGIIVLPSTILVTTIVVSTIIIGGRYLLNTYQIYKLKKEINNGHIALIHSICAMAEYRDLETGLHIIRTQHYIKILANYLKNIPEYTPLLTPERIQTIFLSAPLHDIGKIGIKDAILLKPGKLTEEEFEVMKTHPYLGSEMIQRIIQQMGSNVFLETAQELVYGHHEKWDGSGYPQGLVGHDIPISARLMAIADVYDALISKRVYKVGFTHQKACEIIATGSGKHFDPQIVALFLKFHLDFLEVAITHAETPEQRDYLKAQKIQGILPHDAVSI